MALKIPSALKLSHLKTLAFKCGISSSGTKPILTQRIIDEISHSDQNDGADMKSARILSIDMGIRNLAYCVLDVPPIPLLSRNLPPSKANKSSIHPPSIVSWIRLAVSTAPPKSNSLSIPSPKEAFDPATLSTAAYNLLRNRLLPLNPTHILLERQRFRSMGSKHILEWTIRVNMFESILYAVLCTLKAEGVWDGEVRAVAPGKVGPFWVGEDDDSREEGVGDGERKKVRRAKSAKVRNKGLKIDLVRNWLKVGQMVTLGNEEVVRMANAYLKKWDGLPGRKSAMKSDQRTDADAVGEEMGKLDDLADSLLQGMAWVQWEENKRIAAKYGVEALLDD